MKWLLLVLLVAFPAAAGADGAHWYKDPTCTTANQLTGVITIHGYGKGESFYWCPTDGVDSPDIIVLGNVATAFWRGSIGSPPGTVKLNVYGACVAASPPSSNCTDLFTGSASGYTQMDPSQPPSTVLTAGPGRYRFHPSSSCSDCSLEFRGN
jgi:hypothetical protein